MWGGVLFGLVWFILCVFFNLNGILNFGDGLGGLGIF
jgi:hypothetical protein